MAAMAAALCACGGGQRGSEAGQRASGMKLGERLGEAGCFVFKGARERGRGLGAVAREQAMAAAWARWSGERRRSGMGEPGLWTGGP